MFPTRAEVEVAALARLRRRGALILVKDDFNAAGTNLFLDLNYERIVDLDLGGPEKLRLGGSSPRVCRYCQKSRPDTTFRQIAHSVPECLGNRRLISLDECDRCNELFSQTFEHHFDNFLRPLRTILAIPGKRGVPAFKSPDGKARVEHNKEKNNFSITEDERGAILTEDERGKAFDMTMSSQPHVPLEVYRCLVKMAFAVLPESEAKHFDATRRWLLDTLASPTGMLPSFAFSHVVFLPAALAAPHVSLWRRKYSAPRAPYMLAAVGFSQCGFMYAVPFSNQDGHLAPGRIFVPTFDLTLTPAFVHAAWETIDLSSSASESSLEHQIHITYDSIEEVACEESGLPPTQGSPSTA
jgi:HNH endonuclease